MGSGMLRSINTHKAFAGMYPVTSLTGRWSHPQRPVIQFPHMEGRSTQTAYSHLPRNVRCAQVEPQPCDARSKGRMEQRTARGSCATDGPGIVILTIVSIYITAAICLAICGIHIGQVTDALDQHVMTEQAQQRALLHGWMAE